MKKEERLNSLEDFMAQLAFRINYCPMCGKQLREDKLK